MGEIAKLDQIMLQVTGSYPFIASEDLVFGGEGGRRTLVCSCLCQYRVRAMFPLPSSVGGIPECTVECCEKIHPSAKYQGVFCINILHRMIEYNCWPI